MAIESPKHLLRAVLILALASAGAHAQDRFLKVIASDSQPIAYAFVQANGGHALLTDLDGRVSIGSGKKQTFTIEVRRIGYQLFYGKIDFPDSGITIPLMLQGSSQQLGAVKVTANASKSSLELSGFYRRWLDAQHGVTSAVFIGPEELEKRNSSRMSMIMSGVSGIAMSRTTNGNSVLMSGGGTCPMAVIIDGRQVCPNGGCLHGTPSNGVTDMNAVLIDQVVDLNSVAGIEVYKRGGNMPSDFHVDGECGAVAIWTGNRKR